MQPCWAEPIWVTAERNGLRAAVTDWPLSQNEAGPAVAVPHFETAFDKNLSDEQRAEHFMNQWADDADAKPLRLIMGYLEATDPAGHRYGPAAPEVLAKLRDTDALLAKVATRAVAIFKRHAAPNDQLYILITTDHGMAAIEHQVNFEKLFSAKLPHAVTFVTSGPVAYVALDQVPDGERTPSKPACSSNFGVTIFCRHTVVMSCRRSGIWITRRGSGALL